MKVVVKLAPHISINRFFLKMSDFDDAFQVKIKFFLSTRLDTRGRWVVKLTPGCLTPGKNFYPLNRSVGGPQRRSRHF